MRIIKLKCIAVLAFLLFTVKVIAQDSIAKSPLVGVWQLNKIIMSSRTDAMNPQNPTLKVFDSDGTLSQVIVSEQGAFILQKGKYEAVDSTHFNDIIWTDSRKDFDRAGKKNLLEYHFMVNGENTFLTLEGSFEDKDGKRTDNWKELWRKVEVIAN